MAISFFEPAGCEVDKIDILSTIRTTKPPDKIGWKKRSSLLVDSTSRRPHFTCWHKKTWWILS